jgi:hypothetical protein
MKGTHCLDRKREVKLSRCQSILFVLALFFSKYNPPDFGYALSHSKFIVLTFVAALKV